VTTEIKILIAVTVSVTVILAALLLLIPYVTYSMAFKRKRSKHPVGELSAVGTDKIEFLIATNAGEPLMPMIKIASGGELARIMLSLRSVLNDLDGTGTVVFDEIDTGISGKTSRKVGIKLLGIGRASQVICVTHSAQIASLADTHFLISKSEKDGRVETSLKTLDKDERVSEIARILGGINITDTQKQAAREMIEEGNYELYRFDKCL